MINALKGMKDRYSDEIKKYDYIIQKAEETFKKQLIYEFSHSLLFFES